MHLKFQGMGDEELARQSQDGSLAAFEELVCRYEGRVYGFVWNCCRHDETSREVTQDTFVRAFQALAQYDPGRPFAGWLFAIARRKLIDYQRAAPRVEAEAVPEEPDLNDPAQLLAGREERQRLWNLARAHLPTAQFQALWLKYAEGMSMVEIARTLGKTGVHVKVLLFRARRTLANTLQRDQSGFVEEANASSVPSAPPPPATVKQMFKTVAPL